MSLGFRLVGMGCAACEIYLRVDGGEAARQVVDLPEKKTVSLEQSALVLDLVAQTVDQIVSLKSVVRREVTRRVRHEFTPFRGVW